MHRQLQQCLPFTVLKQANGVPQKPKGQKVATVLTVYGIETVYSADITA